MQCNLGDLKAQHKSIRRDIERAIYGATKAIVSSAVQTAANTTSVKVRTGAMKAGWASTVVRVRNGSKGTLLNDVPHAFFQEKGTGLWGPNHAKYKIEARNARALRFEIGGVVFYRHSVMHPGVKPQYIGRAAMYGHARLLIGGEHDRNIALLTKALQRAVDNK